MRVINIQNSNIKQVKTYESHRKSQEFDPDYSDCDDDITSIDRYSMDREQADYNRNESNNGWVECVLNRPKEIMEDILYMVASVPIIYFSFIRNFTWKPGTCCPCLCPFNKSFVILKNKYIPHNDILFIGQIKCEG